MGNSSYFDKALKLILLVYHDTTCHFGNKKLLHSKTLADVYSEKLGLSDFIDKKYLKNNQSNCDVLGAYYGVEQSDEILKMLLADIWRYVKGDEARAVACCAH